MSEYVASSENRPTAEELCKLNERNDLCSEGTEVAIYQIERMINRRKGKEILSVL